MWWLIAGLGIFSCIGIVFILRYHRLRNSINQMRIQLEEILENLEDNRILLLDYFQEDLELFCKTMNDYIQINQKIRILQRNKEKKLRMQIESISHDLRTPLTSIYGSASAIAEKADCLSKEQILQLAKGIEEDSQWLMAMVENLLSVT